MLNHRRYEHPNLGIKNGRSRWTPDGGVFTKKLMNSSPKNSHIHPCKFGDHYIWGWLIWMIGIIIPWKITWTTPKMMVLIRWVSLKQVGVIFRFLSPLVFRGGKYQINHRGLGPRFTFPFLFWVGGKMILAKRWIDLSGPIFFKWINIF